MDIKTFRNFLVLSFVIFGTVYFLKNKVEKEEPVTADKVEVIKKEVATPQKQEVKKVEEKVVAKVEAKKLKEIVPIPEKILPGSKDHRKIVMDRVKEKVWYQDGQKYVAAYIYDYVPKNWSKGAANNLSGMFDTESVISKNSKDPKLMNVSNGSASSGCKVTPYPKPFVIIGSNKHPGTFGSINMFAKVECGGRTFTGLFNVKTNQLEQVLGAGDFEGKGI